MLPYRLQTALGIFDLRKSEPLKTWSSWNIRTDHILAKFGNISDSNNYAFLQHGGRGRGFCIMLEISSSRTISGWVIGRFRQHHIFSLRTLPTLYRILIKSTHIKAWIFKIFLKLLRLLSTDWNVKLYVYGTKSESSVNSSSPYLLVILCYTAYAHDR
jgi:hypothetical protein